MQELPSPPDAGFVVDWQIADDGPVIDLSSDVDLSTAGSEVNLTADTRVRTDPAPG
jgi:hypothetical protein